MTKEKFHKKNTSKSMVLMLVNPIYIQVIKPHINWLTKARKKEQNKSALIGINASIILFSVCYLEGFLEDILCSFVDIPYHSQGKDNELVRLEAKVRNLDTYKQELQTYGVRLENALSNIDLEDLEMIFYFRNLLTHGQRESYTIHADNPDLENAKIKGGYYEKLDKFLIKRKIIKKNTHFQGNQIDIIYSKQVADWVLKRIEELTKKILDHIQLFESKRRANIERIKLFLKKEEQGVLGKGHSPL